ncbi:MAG: PorT family protein [Sphingobacteriales bacterium]|nr:MAG: PorT family protein [Sphingobacteriales bacterium]
MKRFIFLLTIFIFSLAKVNAQNIQYALRLGANATNGSLSSTRYSSDSKFLPGGYVGVQMKVFFDPPIYFNPQLNIIHKGTEFMVRNNDTVKLKLEINQIQLAPYLQVDFHKKGEPGFNINGGLSLYTAINGKETITKSDGITTKKDMRFSKTAYGRFEAGIHLGVGYDVKKISIQLMYNRGFSNLFNGDNSSDFSGPVIKMHSVSLGLAWYLN